MCGGRNRPKKKKPRCVPISFKAVAFLGLYNHLWSSYANSSKTVSPLSATLNAAHCVKTNYARTSLFRHYFFNRITIIWNGIPEDIKVATTLCSFKRQLKSFYFKRLYNVFDGDNVRSFKIICPKCRRVNILKACSC